MESAGQTEDEAFTWQGPHITKEPGAAIESPPAFIEYGTLPGLVPSDDKMVDVWLALHGDKESKNGTNQVYSRLVRTKEEQELYDLLTKSLIERAKNYGSLERP